MYNPANDFYMRNAQQQMLPFQQFTYQPPAPPQIRANWVSSVEEAKASQIDFVSTNLFLDTANGKIYLKRIGDNGKPQFITYSIEDDVKPTDPLSEINIRLSNIENFLGGLNESVPSNAGVQKSPELFDSTVTGKNERNDETEPSSFPKNAGNDKWKKRN